MTLDELRAWAASAPAGTMLSASALAECLSNTVEIASEQRSTATATEPPTWREKLWTCPTDVRIGVREVSEALDRAESWVYRHTSRKSGIPLLPHKKLDGQLVFVVGEIRGWIQRNEQTIVAGRTPLHLTRSGAA
jgi:predicted DNA-binding transcriptional regulator AlpA